jgi:hypothetical protein
VSGLQEIMEAIAGSLDTLTATVPGLQVTWFQNASPTPPALDVYPDAAAPPQISMNGWRDVFVIRARVTTPDDIGAQQVLLSMMNVAGPGSVMAALRADQTFGGVVGGSGVIERSGFFQYPGDLLGCEWRLETVQ